MDCVSPILDVATCLWTCTSKRAAYVRNLEGNLKTLKGTMEELNNLSKDVIERIQHEELQQRRRTHEVEGWLDAVRVMGAEVEKILQDGDQEIQKKCLRICPKNCWSSFELGKIVTGKIDAVTKLTVKGHFDVLTQSLPNVQVEKRPMGKTVGLDWMFKKVERWLADEQVRSIGLYGIGGVGKTTLLQKINNDFFGKRSDFLVIWAVVSKPINIEKIQEVILKRLPVKDDTWKSSSKEEKAAMIFNILLRVKNFVILLDDMWDRLNLFEVGIPPLNDQTKSKLVLTTRSERICNEMGVHHKFKMECLTQKEAFSLFCDNVGQNIMKSHPDIKKLAEIVVEECKGLPLALVVIGRSMASRKTPREWEQAIRMLQSYPAKFSGMGDQVFPILKFSYDHLGNDTLKSCFLHCSLFPEDHIFSESELINLWIGEGFLSEWDDIYEARNQGEEIIRNFKLACLLESDVTKNRYKMHDTIRDMGRWLSCDYGEGKQKNFVAEHVQLIKAFEIVRWKVAQRIFLWHCNFKNAPSVSPCFPNLQTFLMRYSGMRSIPIGFFQFMPIIRVLDLSDNKKLEELPSEICGLESLEYLNLASTSINMVPMELKRLEKLRCLILDDMRRLRAIPSNVISCLSNLRMFSMTNSAVGGYKECLQELECLQCLSEISITLYSSFAVKKFLTSQKLEECVRRLTVNTCMELYLLELPLSTLQRLKIVVFNSCYDLERVTINKQSEEEKQRPMSQSHISNSCFQNLVTVVIQECRFVDLTWLIYAPSLEYLSVRESRKLEEIIRVDECGESKFEEQNLSAFSRLANLILGYLPKLKSIYKRPLPFPSLTEIKVFGCPNLRKLPLNSSSATNTLKKIEGYSSWWEKLEWESDDLKSTFAPYFQSRGD